MHFNPHISEIILLYKQRQQLQTMLMQRGKGQDEINRLLEQWSHENHGGGSNVVGGGGTLAGPGSVVGTPTSAASSQKDRPEELASLPHVDPSTWLMPGNIVDDEKKAVCS